MEPHIQRIVDEQKELATKICKLDDFIDNSPIYEKLSSQKKLLLIRQSTVMEEYSDILKQRLELEGVTL